MPESNDSQDALAGVLNNSLKQASTIAVLKLLVILVASLALGVGALVAALNDAGGIAWAGAVLFAASGLFALRGLLSEIGLATRRPGSAGPSPWTVTVRQDHIACRRGRRGPERVAWNALVTVGLRADDAIPVGDIYWLLFDESGGVCIAPIGAQGSEELLEAMRKRLPGFNNEAVIEIMGALDGGAVVWERAAVHA